MREQDERADEPPLNVMKSPLVPALATGSGETMRPPTYERIPTGTKPNRCVIMSMLCMGRRRRIKVENDATIIDHK